MRYELGFKRIICPIFDKQMESNYKLKVCFDKPLKKHKQLYVKHLTLKKENLFF